MSTDQLPNYGDICTPTTLVTENPDLLTTSQINWLVKTRELNGLSKSGAVLMVSRKIYLVRHKFWDWFIEQRAQ